MDLWGKKGPIGKLHNVVKFIRNTPQRREAFISITVGNTLTDTDFDRLMVKSDNATRWNSAYDMIHRALKLRRRIDIYCFDHKSFLEQDTLTPDDWTSLTILNSILEPFKKDTINLQGRRASGSYGTAWEVLPTIHKLLRHVKEQKTQFLATACLVNSVHLNYIISFTHSLGARRSFKSTKIFAPKARFTLRPQL